MPHIIDWKVGYEIELLSPRGSTRKHLADAIASHYEGSTKRVFSRQSEPSKVPGKPTFESLCLGYEVYNSHNELIVTCVDDLTIRKELNPQALSMPGWYRIVSDDPRFLHLITKQCDATDDLEQVMKPLADLFKSDVVKGQANMIRVEDSESLPIAIAAPLLGERERPCEVVTAPLVEDHYIILETILTIAKELEFTLPFEGATHIHFDGQPFCDTKTFVATINLLEQGREIIKASLHCNPNCLRLGPWPDSLLALVKTPVFQSLSWQQARDQLKPLKLSKYCDFNLLNLVSESKSKHTIEIRVLPASLSAKEIIDATRAFECLFQLAQTHDQRLNFDFDFKPAISEFFIDS